MLNRYMEIDGLDGNQPVGAALTIGTKGDLGFPVDRDKLYFKTPIMADGVRDPHPAFKAWHKNASPEQRKTIRGNIVHASRSECFEHYLRNQSRKGHNPPNKQPYCTGDGKVATRWVDGDWKVIPCPHELCEFRLGNVKACKPFARLLFMPGWDAGTLPSLLTKFTTGSWNTVRNLVGFFEYAESQAAQCGIEHPNFFGLPFVLELTKKTSARAKTAYPVMTITPTMSLVDFFAHQRKQLEAAGSSGAPRLLAIGSPDQQDPEVVAADLAEINPGIPSVMTVSDGLEVVVADHAEVDAGAFPAPADEQAPLNRNTEELITYDQAQMLIRLGKAAKLDVERAIIDRYKVTVYSLPLEKLSDAQAHIGHLAKVNKR